MGKTTKKTLEELEAERLALEQEAYDEKNRMLKQSQFQELLELKTDEEPEFVEEIVTMFVDDAEAMLVELEELFVEGADAPIDYAKARGVLHKLKGSLSTFGADGVQQKCEELREAALPRAALGGILADAVLAELRERVDELAAFLARYTAKTKEIQEAKAAASS